MPRWKRTTGGLSPRGRGNLGFMRFCEAHQRSIPAWAGEPPFICLVSNTTWVYPRVGGGTHKIRPNRVRTAGLSPRGRGNPVGQNPGRYQHGSIPAWAGEPIALGFQLILCEVYPRVGGGTCPSLFVRQ